MPNKLFFIFGLDSLSPYSLHKKLIPGNAAPCLAKVEMLYTKHNSFGDEKGSSKS